jgi:hypothetical protein
MPYIPPKELDTADREETSFGGITLPTNQVGGLSAAELAEALAASGQRIVSAEQAATELARKRRRIGPKGSTQ